MAEVPRQGKEGTWEDAFSLRFSRSGTTEPSWLVDFVWFGGAWTVPKALEGQRLSAGVKRGSSHVPSFP